MTRLPLIMSCSQGSARLSRRVSRGDATSARATRRSPEDARFLFVPLQVPDDSQMILFAGWCGGLEGFIDALAEASAALPEGWHLRLKEHPSAKRSVRARIERHIAAGARLELDNARDSFAQLEASAGVLTVNSSMGLQAMFFDKPVIVTGEAFFAFEGVAHPAGSPQELAQLLADPDALGHDGDLRARFLTWLAHDYYIDFDGKGADRLRAAWSDHEKR